MTGGGDLQLSVDLFAEDATDEPAISDSFVGERPGRDPAIEQGFNASPDVETVGPLQIEGELVPGEQTRVQADQGDPLSLLPGEADILQQFFPSLQAGNYSSPGLGHGVSMPADSSLLIVMSRDPRLAHFLRGTASPSVESARTPRGDCPGSDNAVLAHSGA